MKASSKLTQASRMGWELGGKATSVGWNPGAPSVGSRVAGNVLILHHTLQSPGSIPRGRDAVNQCWAWGTGISCAACMKLVEMKSQKPATNEKWEAWDVMLKGRKLPALGISGNLYGRGETRFGSSSEILLW